MTHPPALSNVRLFSDFFFSHLSLVSCLHNSFRPRPVSPLSSIDSPHFLVIASLFQMAKDIYKTFKRSISGIAGGNTSNLNGESSSGPSTSGSSSHAKYRGGSGRTWIHPPDYLINGRVEYVARFMGTVETAKPHGSDVAREAIHAIRFQRDLKRSEQTRETAKLQKVDIAISIDSVTISDTKTKDVLYTFPLGRISFCADDKDDKRMFSFIARAEGSEAKHSCYAFTSEKLAEDITLTIGEAFDLAYKRFLDKNRTSLENQKQVFILRKKIAELEAENQVLIERLAAALRGNSKVNGGDHHSVPDIAAPALPLSPMPAAPPPNMNSASSIYSMPRGPLDLSTPPAEQAPRLPPISTKGSPNSSPSSTSPSGPAPSLPPPRPPALAPPPPVAPRRNPSVTSPKTSLAGLDLGESKKPVASDVFDDSFDPRAHEKKMEQQQQPEYNPFGADFLPNLSQNGDKPPSAAAALLASEAIAQLPPPEASASSSGPLRKTAAEYDAMISEVEKKLAAMSSGSFEFGNLQTGDLGGIEGESDYGTPSDRLNPKVMNLKQ